MQEILLQDYVIYSRTGLTCVRGSVDQVEIAAETDAASAIQTAINQLANGGGEVLIQRGDYELATTLKLASNVSLHGSGRGTRLHVRSEMGVLAEGLHGAVVSDLALLASSGAAVGIILDDCGDCQLRDVFCRGFVDYGIWVRNNSFLCEVRGCKLVDNGQANLYFDTLAQGGRGGDFVPNLATNCIIYGGGTGIETRRTIVLNLVGCIVFQPRKFGFHIHSTSNSVLISGCRTFQCESHAVVIDDSDEINISSNIFCWQRGDGIVLKDVAWGAINGNEIIDSGVRVRQLPLTIGLHLQGQTCGVQATGNTIFNWGDQLPMQSGIVEAETCHDNLIANNNINFFREFDVVSRGKDSKAVMNHGIGSPSYVGEDRAACPDFDREPITKFIQRLFDH